MLPEAQVPGISELLYRFHDSIQDLQRRVLRIVADGLGRTRTSSRRCCVTARP
ncbi:MAG: hypothetical protein R2715_03905 [Ilumatobacteraceae bacterium]